MFEKVLEPEQLEGYQTLIIGIGGSVKGLGEAGIDTQSEIDRINRVIEAARKQDMLIIAMHTGGHPPGEGGIWLIPLSTPRHLRQIY